VAKLLACSKVVTWGLTERRGQAVSRFLALVWRVVFLFEYSETNDILQNYVKFWSYPFRLWRMDHSLGGLRYRNARLLKHRTLEFGKSSRHLRLRTHLIIEHKQYVCLRLFNHLCLFVDTLECNNCSIRWTTISPVIFRLAALRIPAIQLSLCFQKSAALLLRGTCLYAPPVVQTSNGDDILPDFENTRWISMGIPPAILTWLLQLSPPAP